MMGTMFIQQGSLMERNIPIPFTNYTVYIPSASMALFNTGGCLQGEARGPRRGLTASGRHQGGLRRTPLSACLMTHQATGEGF
jgi:hypothetical protein